MFFVLLFGLIIQYLVDIILILIGWLSIYLIKTNIQIFDSDNDNENTDKLLKFINDTAYNPRVIYHQGEKRPDGLCFSWKNKYISYIFNSSQATRERVKVTSKIYYLGKLKIDIIKGNKLIDVTDENDKKIIMIWDKTSDFLDSYIYKMEVPFNFEPYPKQVDILDQIINHWNNSKIYVSRTLIYGDPGSGKSFLGKLLASKLNGELATYINLGSPGCGFRHLYKKSSPNKDKPLIIQLDEIDVIIENIHYQKNSTKHDWLITECYNKITYNNFWSEFVINYPFVIWLCTMNKTPNEINKLDECYLRNNRIDLLIPYCNKDN